MHAQHDAAVGVFRRPEHLALVEARRQHREQDAVGVSVGRVAAGERGVRGEAVQRRRIEAVDPVGRDLHRARAAVDVLTGLLVGHPVGKVKHAVGRVRQTIVGRQRVAGGRHRGGRHVTGRCRARIAGRAVREVVLGDTEIAARVVVCTRKQCHDAAERTRGAVLHAGHVELAELGAVAAHGLRWGDRATGRHGLIGQPASEVGRDPEGGLRPDRGGPQRVGGVAEQVLVADRERLLLRRGQVVGRNGVVQVGLERGLPDRGPVQRQEWREQVQDVDVGWRRVDGLRPGRAGHRHRSDGKGQNGRRSCEPHFTLTK